MCSGILIVDGALLCDAGANGKKHADGEQEPAKRSLAGHEEKSACHEEPDREQKLKLTGVVPEDLENFIETAIEATST